MMDFKKAGKFVLPVAGFLLTMAASVVNSKSQDEKMKETIAEKVAEALANQDKGES